GFNGAFALWFDSRSTTDSGSYVARIAANGTTGTSAITVSTVAVNPVAGGVELAWSAFLTGEAEFQVYRSSRGEGPFEPVGEVIHGAPGQADFHFRDEGVTPGATVYYQLAWQDRGQWQRSGTVMAVGGQAVFALHPVAPNPARAGAEFNFEIARAG